MAVGLSLLSVPVWHIFYGASKYGPKVFQVSIFVAVFSSISTNIMVILQSVNKNKRLYISLISGFLFNVIFNIPFMVWFYKIGLPIYYGNLVATMLLQPCAIFANGPPWIIAGVCSKVCTRFGLKASFSNTVNAPSAFKSLA